MNEILGLTLSTEESDTLGGYIYSVLGHVPQAGEGFEANQLLIKVESITGRRIRKVHVTRLVPEGEHTDESGEHPTHESSSGNGKRTTRINPVTS